jgi:hypothetical protein
MVLFYRIFFRPDHRALIRRMHGTSNPPHSMARALANALTDQLPDAMIQIGFCQLPESCYYSAA